jgi:large subunit ribosomal protein L18
MRKQHGKIKNSTMAKRVRRRLAIRKKIVGSAERPRVCATKSNKNLMIQVIDDAAAKTIFCVQTFGKNAVTDKSNVDGAKIVGSKVAEKLKENKISNVVFDRCGNKYTGVLAALVDTMRENGIQI